MSKIFFTLLIISTFFTFATIAIAIIGAFVDSVITSETEDRINRLCAKNLLLAGFFWGITIIDGLVTLICIIWR